MIDDYREPKELSPHPLNVEIYGDSLPDKDFIDSIKNGIYDPIVITENNEKAVIISGHRRWRAALHLKIKRVPVRSVGFKDEASLLIALIEFNRQREKTATMIIKEAALLEKVEKMRAKERKVEGSRKGGQGHKPSEDKSKDEGKKPQPSSTPAKREPQSRDKVAKQIGTSARTLAKLQEIDKAAKGGDSKARLDLGKIDRKEKSINKAYNELVKRQKEKSLTDIEKQNIAQAKVDKEAKDYLSKTSSMAESLNTRLREIMNNEVRFYSYMDVALFDSLRGSIYFIIEAGLLMGVDVSEAVKLAKATKHKSFWFKSEKDTIEDINYEEVVE